MLSTAFFLILLISLVRWTFSSVAFQPQAEKIPILKESSHFWDNLSNLSLQEMNQLMSFRSNFHLLDFFAKCSEMSPNIDRIFLAKWNYIISRLSEYCDEGNQRNPDQMKVTNLVRSRIVKLWEQQLSESLPNRYKQSEAGSSPSFHNQKLQLSSLREILLKYFHQLYFVIRSLDQTYHPTVQELSELIDDLIKCFFVVYAPRFEFENPTGMLESPRAWTRYFPYPNLLNINNINFKLSQLEEKAWQELESEALVRKLTETEEHFLPSIIRGSEKETRQVMDNEHIINQPQGQLEEDIKHDTASKPVDLSRAEASPPPSNSKILNTGTKYAKGSEDIFSLHQGQKNIRTVLGVKEPLPFAPNTDDLDYLFAIQEQYLSYHEKEYQELMNVNEIVKSSSFLSEDNHSAAFSHEFPTRNSETKTGIEYLDKRSDPVSSPDDFEKVKEVTVNNSSNFSPIFIASTLTLTGLALSIIVFFYRNSRPSLEEVNK